MKGISPLTFTEIKGEPMFKAQLKFQKILSFLLIGVFVVYFIYALSIMTNIYVTLYAAYDLEKEELVEAGFEETAEYVKGAKIFYNMQDFNTQLLFVAVGVILISLTFFITCSKSRRKYYIGNYISAGLISVANIAAAIFTIINLSIYRAQYLLVDFEELKAFSEKNNTIYSDSTFCFDIGYVISALLIIVAGLLIFNVIWKKLLMKKENELLNGEAAL